MEVALLEFRRAHQPWRPAVYTPDDRHGGPEHGPLAASIIRPSSASSFVELAAGISASVPPPRGTHYLTTTQIFADNSPNADESEMVARAFGR